MKQSPDFQNPRAGYEPVLEHQRSAVWGEVLDAEKFVGSQLAGDIPPYTMWDSSDPNQLRLASAFKRGKEILRALSYGDRYWTINYGLFDLTQKADFEGVGKHESVRLGTDMLIRLVLLSKVKVEPVDRQPQWALPSHQAILAAKNGLRNELSLRDPSEIPRVSGEDFSLFPGIDEGNLVDSIINGRVTVGNVEQPDPRPYRG